MTKHGINQNTEHTSKLFEVGDLVEKLDKSETGEVWKMSEKGVHVRYKRKGLIENYFDYEVFHFKPTHHMQTHVNQLVKIEP